MADSKAHKPTASAEKNAQSMYDHFVHGSKISVIVIIAVLFLMYLGLIA